MATFRSWVEQVTSGIEYARAHYGQRYFGLKALITDLASEGLRQGFFTRLYGHPDVAQNTLNVQGDSLGLFRFRLEGIQSWRKRIREVWQSYEQAGTPQQMIRAIEEWGQSNFAWDPNVANVTLTELGWADFLIGIPDGRLPWTTGQLWGSFVWGDGTLWGIGNANHTDVAMLIRVIKKWKPSRSIAYVEVINGSYTVTFKVY
jgi:hypothetical protein